MTVALGVVLGAWVFLWARSWLGLGPALFALAAYTFEPNLRGHASLVTTDVGVTCLIFGSVYFAWRLSHGVTRGAVAGLVACTALAVVSKFSAVLLAPVLVLLLAAAVRRRQIRGREALAVVAACAIVSYAAIWAAYGFRHAPAPGAAALGHSDALVSAAPPLLASVIGAADAYHLLPNAYAFGFLYTMASVSELPSYFAGRYSSAGWWYYFPAAILLKTPTALILLAVAGLCVLAWRGAGRRGDALYVVLPAAVFLAAAMWTGINIGVRHVLPVFPFLILIAAAALQRVPWRSRGGVCALVLIVAGWGSEVVRAYPHPLTFFNTAAGGPANGHRYLADSNLGWGSGLKALEAWMAAGGVTHVNLAYFGQADPLYYGIACTHLPGAPSFAMDAVARPTLPGYVAISATVLTGVYASPEWRLFYAPFAAMEPAAVVGNSIYVYWVEEWPSLPPADAAAVEPGTHLMLAEALLHGLRWPERAASHYEQYLAARPSDADALASYGAILDAGGQLADGIAVLRRAIAIDERQATARLTLAKAFFIDRNLAAAAEQVAHVVALRPGEAEGYVLRGRLSAVQGRLADAERDFQHAVRLDARHTGARELLDRVRQSSGRSADAPGEVRR